MNIRSVLYIPEYDDLWQTLSRLGAYADDRGWPAEAYTRSWTDLMWLLVNGPYQIGIVPSMTALAPDRLPRIVAVDEDRRPIMPRMDRPRWLPRH